MQLLSLTHQQMIFATDKKYLIMKAIILKVVKLSVILVLEENFPNLLMSSLTLFVKELLRGKI